MRVLFDGFWWVRGPYSNRQVLREFMREYVAHVRQGRTGKDSVITPAEQGRRQNAFHSALASVGLEGFTVPVEYEIQAKRFIEGEVEFAELTKAVHEQAKKR